jgi:hypothetical protein
VTLCWLHLTQRSLARFGVTHVPHCMQGPKAGLWLPKFTRNRPLAHIYISLSAILFISTNALLYRLQRRHHRVLTRWHGTARMFRRLLPQRADLASPGHAHAARLFLRGYQTLFHRMRLNHETQNVQFLQEKNPR